MSLAGFVAFNILVSLAISSGYFIGLGWLGLDWALVAVISLSHYGSFWLVAGLVLAVLRLPFGTRPSFRWVAGTIAFLVQVLLCSDMVIYGLYRYHINGAVLTIFTGDALGESIRLGAQTTLTIVAIIALLGLVQASYFRFLAARFGPPGPRLRRTAVALILAAVAVDKSAYAYGDLYNRTSLVKYARLYPLYLPLTIKDFALKRLHIKVDREADFAFAPESSLLNYQVPADLPCTPPAARPNFLLIVLDSWRYDMIGGEITPNIHRFARQNWEYTDNWSGGNATRQGIFPLFYGIHSTYWAPFLAERKGPAMIEVLKRMGYSFRIISSTKLTFPEFRRTAFVDIPEAVVDQLPGDRPALRDAAQPGELFRFLDSPGRKGKPFFAFLYMDSPHSPYDFGDGFDYFKPVAKYVNYLAVRGDHDWPHVNRYRNGIRFDDYLVGKVLEGLASRGLLESTVVFITADHGEEFGESGYWGHTNAFTRQQCQVPLVARYPGKGARRVTERTSNLDVPFTVLELAGCAQVARDLTLGRSLLAPTARDYVVANGWHSCAIFTGGNAITYNTDFRRSPELLVRDMKYQPLPEAEMKAALRASRPILKRVIEEQRRFLK